MIKLLGDFDPEGKKEVDDPYYGGNDGFEVNFQHIQRSLLHFYEMVDNNENIE